MTQSEQPGQDPVSLSKDGSPSGEPVAGVDFDPYRFGAPEHPIPPEYAPPGYVPPPAAHAPPTYPGAQYPGAQYPGPQFPTYPAAPPPYPGQPYPGQPNPGQQYPGQQYPPSPPPYPGYGGSPQHLPTGHGKAVAALVLGIASIVLCWLTLFDAVPVILGIVFGALGLRESRFKHNREGRGMAIAGIVCAIIGALLAITLTVLIYTRFKDCLHMDTGSSAYNSCIRDHL